MSNDLLNSGAINANWANLYAKEISTQNVNTDSITADDNIVCNGQITGNTIVSNGNILALNRLEGNNLVILDDSDLTATWVNNVGQSFTLTENDSLKGTIFVNMNNVTVGVDNLFTVRIFHPAITAKSRIYAILSHDQSSLTNANFLLYTNNFSELTNCVNPVPPSTPGFAQLLLRNCGLNPINLGTSTLEFQFFVC